ncbi:MAG: P1 family peptidase [Balneolaceae bacterium]
MRLLLFLIFSLLFSLANHTVSDAQQRARDLGITPGILQPGPLNAITDVEGVQVGHVTRIEGDDIRTGVTAILPHDGNLFRDRVPAAVYVGNGFGKALGFTQVQELGELETPIALTNTLDIFQIAHGVADVVLSYPENRTVRSVNPVVGETNDGYLHNIRKRALTPDDARHAIEAAASGAVAEGNTGAGTGTRALGFKGGIGTSSRVLPENRGGYTVGVLVQANFGGILTIDGVPVGEELNRHYMAGNRSGQSFSEQMAAADTGYDFDVDGSVMIVVATDAPLTSRNLERLAKRAFLGIARVGGFASNGSGDYVIAFSTAEEVRIRTGNEKPLHHHAELRNSDTTPLFLAALEATEEAILNALFAADDMTGHEGRSEQALPVDEVLEIIKRYKTDGD